MNTNSFFGVLPLLLTACNIDIDVSVNEQTDIVESESFVMHIDIDGDLELEGVTLDSDQAPENTTITKLDDDADFDEVIVGTYGNAKLGEAINIDDDSDFEVVVYDSTLPTDASFARDLDGDFDSDLLIIGTAATGSEPVGKDSSIDIDDDSEMELVLFDGNLPAGEQLVYDLDGDGDDDLIVNAVTSYLSQEEALNWLLTRC